MTRHLDATETAKLIRKALKANFPGVKFSVRSYKYAGGSSIRVRWDDGPTYDAVNPVCQAFAGHVEPAHCVGTTGSAGIMPGYDVHRIGDDAEPVHLGGDFVFCERDISDGLRQHVADIYLAADPDTRQELCHTTDAFRGINHFPKDVFSYSDTDFSAFDYDADRVLGNIVRRIDAQLLASP